jgi:hypothetical protein
LVIAAKGSSRDPKLRNGRTKDVLFPNQGLIAAIVSDIAKRSPALGALVASLPLLSIMAVIWLWRDTADAARIASQMEATFWYVLPSLPMFLLMPAMLRGGVGFWPALVASCMLTSVLYLTMASVLARFGIQL